MSSKNATFWKVFDSKVPILGLSLFSILFIYATVLYPGGSQADLNSTGFDWVHNYYCNLMSVKAVNGQVNPARVYGISSLIILCLTIVFTSIQLAFRYEKDRLWQYIILISACSAMVFAGLIATRLHDVMIITSSLCGLLLVIGALRRFVKDKAYDLLVLCLLSIFLLVLDNIIYYSNYGIEALPVLQKISIVVVMILLIRINTRAM